MAVTVTFRCTKCGRVDEVKWAYIEYMATHGLDYVCDECDPPFVPEGK